MATKAQIEKYSLDEANARMAEISAAFDELRQERDLVSARRRILEAELAALGVTEDITDEQAAALERRLSERKKLKAAEEKAASERKTKASSKDED